MKKRIEPGTKAFEMLVQNILEIVEEMYNKIKKEKKLICYAEHKLIKNLKQIKREEGEIIHENRNEF